MYFHTRNHKYLYDATGQRLHWYFYLLIIIWKSIQHCMLEVHSQHEMTPLHWNSVLVVFKQLSETSCRISFSSSSKTKSFPILEYFPKIRFCILMSIAIILVYSTSDFRSYLRLIALIRLFRQFIYYSDSAEDDFFFSNSSSEHSQSHSTGINENIMYCLKAQCKDSLYEMFF